MTEEILDIVDEHDVIIGSLPRSEVYAKNMNTFRVINCFIRNSKRELWIPRRVSTKKLFPLCLDVSCGGHVSSGETYEEAFAKEMSEELNIDITKTVWKELKKLTPEKDGVSAFMKVYEVISDIAPNFNPTDFSEYYWLTPEQVVKKIKEGDISKEDLPKLLKICYL